MNSYMGFRGPVSLVKVFHIIVTCAPGGTLLTFNRGETGTFSTISSVGVGVAAAVGVGVIAGVAGIAVGVGVIAVGVGVIAGVAGIAVGVGVIAGVAGIAVGAIVGAAVGWVASSVSSSPPQATMRIVSINAVANSA